MSEFTYVLITLELCSLTAIIAIGVAVYWVDVLNERERGRAQAILALRRRCKHLAECVEPGPFRADYRTIELHEKRFAAWGSMPVQFDRGPDVKTAQAFLNESLETQLTASVWAQDYATRVVRFPDGPWQALRARYWPKWALRRAPVRMTEVRHKVTALYPWLALKAPPNHGPIVLAMLDSPAIRPVLEEEPWTP